MVFVIPGEVLLARTAVDCKMRELCGTIQKEKSKKEKRN